MPEQQKRMAAGNTDMGILPGLHMPPSKVTSGAIVNKYVSGCAALLAADQFLQLTTKKGTSHLLQAEQDCFGYKATRWSYALHTFLLTCTGGCWCLAYLWLPQSRVLFLSQCFLEEAEYVLVKVIFVRCIYTSSQVRPEVLHCRCTACRHDG